jgi:hypothetical protein
MAVRVDWRRKRLGLTIREPADHPVETGSTIALNVVALSILLFGKWWTLFAHEAEPDRTRLGGRAKTVSPAPKVSGATDDVIGSPPGLGYPRHLGYF